MSTANYHKLIGGQENPKHFENRSDPGFSQTGPTWHAAGHRHQIWELYTPSYARENAYYRP